MFKPCPLKFKPIFKERIWGGDRLKRLLNKDITSDKPIGESWELTDLPGDASVVADSPLADVTLREVLDRYGGEYGFSADQCRQPFGLMIKFLDADDFLSVQVHPDETTAELFPAAQPKTECWYVLAARPDSVIYRGLKPGVGEKQLRQALTDGGVEKLLQSHPARPGDFHFLPGGAVHALGAGLVVAEIQMPSDTTFRLFDWNRLDSQGRPRELHIEQSLRCIRYDAIAAQAGRPSVLQKSAEKIGTAKTLVNCRYFSVLHAQIDSGPPKAFQPPLPFVMIALEGNGVISTDAAPDCSTPYRPGDTILVPAGETAIIQADQATRCLWACLGETAKS